MIKKSMHFSFKIFVEILLGVVFVVLLAGVFVAYKFQSKTINLDRAIPYLESQFNDNSVDEKISVGSLRLEWQGIKNPLGIQANDVTISNKRGPFLFSPEIDLNISLRSLLLGNLRIESMWVRRVALSITKTVTGEIQITGQSTDNINKKSEQDNASIPAIVTLNSLIYDLPNLDTLWIDKAKIIYRDVASKQTHVFDPATIFIEMTDINENRNLSGFLTFPFGKSQNKNIAKINFNTETNPIALNVSGSINKTPIDSFLPFLPKLPNGWNLNMIVSGETTAQLDNLWLPQKLNLKINAPKGQINFPLNDKKEFISVNDFNIHITQNPQSKTITVHDIKGTINDKVGVSLSGQITNFETPENIAGNIDLNIKKLPHSWIKKYWPQNETDNGAYTWLVENMNGGEFKSISLHTQFDKSLKSNDRDLPLPAWLKTVTADFVYDGIDVDYMKPMAVAKKVTGTGTFKDVELRLNVAHADVGGIIISDGELYFDDLITAGTGILTLKLPVKSNAQNVFNYIENKPINAFKHIDFKPKNTKGDVDAIVDISIPLLKNLPIEDIKVVVNGIIDNANIPNAVRGLTLSNGPFKIYATTEEIKIEGSGKIQGKPITLDWHEYFSANKDRKYLSKIDAVLTANDRIRRAFIRDIADYFKGDTDIKLNYIKPSSGKNTDIKLDLDLKNTAIEVSGIGLNKKHGQQANAKLDVHLIDGYLSSIKNLKITGKNIGVNSGNIRFKTVGNEPYINKVTLKNVSFNENLFSVLVAKQNSVLKTNITGSFLDARPFLNQKKGKFNQTKQAKSPRTPMEIGIDIQKIRTSKNATIKQAKSYIRLDKYGQAEQFELDGKLGKHGELGNLHIRYTPDVSDGLTLRVESNNAGETLRSFDLYPHIIGGTLEIAGKPLEGGRFGDVQGRARINNFEVGDAPVLLRLINALSFENFLNTRKLSFSRLESDFEWKLGANGDLYKISNGTTSGASVGLTFDGYIDTQEDKIDIKGTAAPMSRLNSLIANIPIIGDILTGGGGALLAATYSIKGTTDEPSVSVNPLSILTPGIIRKMLFESTPKSDRDKEPIIQKDRSRLN